MKNFKIQKEKALFSLATVLLIIYKIFWGAIAASWREDESTVIWIADNITAINTHVGLVSSVGLPYVKQLKMLQKQGTN